MDLPVKQLTVFSICARNFTAYAKTLFDSVRRHHPSADMFLFLCDAVDDEYARETFPFTIVPLEDLAIPNVEEMSQRYNITEFNTAIKPYAFSYLFNRLRKDTVVYLDPDILLLGPLDDVLDGFARGYDCLLTPHILEPAEDGEVRDIWFLQYGIYNLGFLGLRNSPEVIRAVDWWSRRLVHDCVIDLPRGVFVDQKWADLFPAFITHVMVIHDPGYNVAYWNIAQRRIEMIDGEWYVNRRRLRFAHFSGNSLADPEILSRHAKSLDRNTIGEMKTLLDFYRDRIYANGHAAYSLIPYSFSWNGKKGVNLHTPKPAEPTDAPAAAESDEPGLLARIRFYWALTASASRMAGGWSRLLLKTARAFIQGGVGAIRHDAQTVAARAKAAPAGGSDSAKRI